MSRLLLPVATVFAAAVVVLSTAWRLQPTPETQVAGAQRPPTSGAVSEAPEAAPTTPANAAPDGETSPGRTALPASCAALPLERRAALVLVVGMPDVTDPDDPLVHELVDLGVGGVFLTGYNVESRDQVRELTAALRSGPGPAPLIATDEEWGRVSSFRKLLGRTSSPRTIAREQSPSEVRRAARDLGSELSDLGVDWDFAPVADLDSGPADGVIGDRAFAGKPDRATDYARAFARGLKAADVIPTIKHFPGHGAVKGDIDPHSKTVRSSASLSRLRRRHLQPFRALINDDIPVVMMNHVTYSALDDLPASMSPAAYRLLRDLGFEGVAITDSVGMGAIHRRWDFPKAAERAIAAGADAVLATDGNQAKRMRNRLVRAVRQGRLDEERLNEAAARMLRLQDRDGGCGTG